MAGNDVTATSSTPAAHERLSVEDVEAGGLLAASHVHRYDVAAAALAGGRLLDLCCGTGYGSRRMGATAASVVGVDVSEEAVADARASVEPELSERVSFETADALAFLRALAPDRFDAVVCF